MRVEELAPGPRLNAIVCEAVGIEPHIEWMLMVTSVDGATTSVFESFNKTRCEYELVNVKKNYPNSQGAKGNIVPRNIYPRVSEEMGAAELVIVRMQERDWLTSVDWHRVGIRARMVHDVEHAPYPQSQDADEYTAPMAICLCALKVFGISEVTDNAG